MAGVRLEVRGSVQFETDNGYFITDCNVITIFGRNDSTSFFNVGERHLSGWVPMFQYCLQEGNYARYTYDSGVKIEINE